jgi:serine protease Do
MDLNVAPAPKQRRVLSARRLVLLASVASLGAAVLFAGPGAPQINLPSIGTSARAETAQRPVGFADVVEKVKPSVISVRVKVDGGPRTGFNSRDLPPGIEQFFRRFGMPDMAPDEQPGQRGHRGGRNVVTGQGSGFFISADGFAVTNNHVVDKAESVEVTADDGKVYTAKVIGTDPKTDLALIKVEGRNDFPFVKLSDSNPRVGDWVLAVGNPFGLGGTVTAGIISARGRDIGAGPYDDFIQIDAPVNKGNSGGPTFDVDGNVIGVNTAIFSPSGGSVGIAFAIPADTVKTVITQLKDKGAVTRGWIGVQIQPVTDDMADSLGMKKAEGALVAEPQADGPAAKAGIKASDVITAVNGQPVRDARDLAKRIGGLAPGATVKLDVFRKGTNQTLSFTLGEVPKEQKQARARADDREPAGTELPRLGLTLAPATGVAGAGGEGVVVTAVDPDGPAANHGIKAGDVILDVGGKAVSNFSDVRKALADARDDGKRAVLMRVKSGDTLRFVALPLGRA